MSSSSSSWIEYETQKVVKIPSYLLKTTFIAWFIGSTIYVFGYAVIWDRGYQLVCPVQSRVISRLEGSLILQFTPEEINVPNPDDYKPGIYDQSDLTVSPSSGLENGGFFLLTNFLLFPNQTRGRCPSAEPSLAEIMRTSRGRRLEGRQRNMQDQENMVTSFINSTCRVDSDCKPGQILNNGITTGRCVPVVNSSGGNNGNERRTCEIQGWCPVGPIIMPFRGSRPIFQDASSVLAIVENSIEFPACGPEYRRRNYHNYTTLLYRKYLSSCIYNGTHQIDRYCPRFRIGDMVREAGADFTAVGIMGGVFVIRISWNCSFDWGFTIKDCLPVYSFRRADDAQTTVLGLGTTFQTVTYSPDNNARSMRLNYGLRFYIEVDGTGRRFDFLTFSLVVGSGLGLIGMAAAITDTILQLLIKLKNHVNWTWLHYYNEEMKYDLKFKFTTTKDDHSKDKKKKRKQKQEYQQVHNKQQDETNNKGMDLYSYQ